MKPMGELEKLLKTIDEKKAKIEAARPLPKIIQDKLTEYLEIDRNRLRN